MGVDPHGFRAFSFCLRASVPGGAHVVQLVADFDEDHLMSHYG